MIINHKTIDLFGKPLFTWITLKTQTNTPVPLPSEACFAYILDGNNEALTTENEELRAEAGQVILSLCGTTVGNMLTQRPEAECSSLVVHFHKDVLKKVYENSKPPLWRELETPVVQYIVQTAASELVKTYFEGITHFFQHRQALIDEILILKLKELILLLLQSNNSPQIIQIMNSLFSERTFSFKEVIDAHICLPVSIENLAQLTNRSVSSFKREFKKIYNSPPATYMVEKRAEKVADLLRLSDESISNIGYECGFSSPAHLSRVFKTKYGMTPTEYRQSLAIK